MSRKDSKGRVLKNGESQRGDGRYTYQYKDLDGKRRSVYSWTLNPSDRVPAGKKAEKSLRELEEEIDKLHKMGICSSQTATVKDIVLLYCNEVTRGKRDSTKHIYNTILNHLEKEPFWNYPIIKIDMLQADAWFNNMMNRDIGYSVLCRCKALLTVSFEEKAVRKNLLLRNPFDFKMPPNDSEETKQKRTALSENQKNSLLSFCLERKVYTRWYYVIIILLHTGLRIGEFLGLTFKDVDFENNTITIDHTITCYYSNNGLYKNQSHAMKIVPPKTKSGIRVIALKPEAKEAFEWLIENRTVVETEPVVCGYSGFIFLNRDGKPSRPASVDSSFRNMIDAYNKCHTEKLPYITPHYLRHTFCSDMVDKGMNPKHVQYLMGHASSRMSMDMYAHANAQSAIRAMMELG